MRTVPEAPAALGAYRADHATSDLPSGGQHVAADAAGLVAEELKRTRRELDAVLSVTPLSVRVFDRDGVLVRASAVADADAAPSAPRTLRQLWERDAPIRAAVGLPLGEEARVAFDEHPGSRALRGERVRAEAYVVRRREGARLVETSAGPVLDAAGRVCGVVLVDRDTTERARLARALEEQIRRTMELNERVLGEAEELERMVDARSRELLAMQEASARERRLAAVGQLAAGVMHDVNNALNPIIAAAYLLRRHADDPERVRDYADRIAKAAETGAASAARVGRFLRQDPPAEGGAGAGPREIPVDLATLADEVLAMTQATLADGARGGPVLVERRYAAGATTRGIAGEIREALLNLLQNAVDAMPDGGRLVVTTAVGAGGEGECWVAVTDTGAGMTDEVRDRAFEPFFTTKGSAGSGLGLAEVYGIMRRHRGRAEVESAPGVGTTVRLVFPYVPSPGRTAEGEGAACAGGAGRSVLVVEDDDDGREFLHALLTSEGHAVETAAGLGEARARLGLAGAALAAAPPGPARREGDAPCDVLLTDVGLADGNGWDLVREARARWPRLRIGVVTGWEAAPPAGTRADRTLRKPLRADELLAFVGAPPAEPLAAGV